MHIIIMLKIFLKKLLMLFSIIAFNFKLLKFKLNFYLYIIYFIMCIKLQLLGIRNFICIVMPLYFYYLLNKIINY